MGNVTPLKRHGQHVVPQPLPSTADRLRVRIARHDQLVKDLAAEIVAIAADARRYADERGEFIRPTIDQLRKRLMGGDA